MPKNPLAPRQRPSQRLHKVKCVRPGCESTNTRTRFQHQHSKGITVTFKMPAYADAKSRVVCDDSCPCGSKQNLQPVYVECGKCGYIAAINRQTGRVVRPRAGYTRPSADTVCEVCDTTNVSTHYQHVALGTNHQWDIAPSKGPTPDGVPHPQPCPSDCFDPNAPEYPAVYTECNNCGHFRSW